LNLIASTVCRKNENKLKRGREEAIKKTTVLRDCPKGPHTLQGSNISGKKIISSRLPHRTTTL